MPNALRRNALNDPNEDAYRFGAVNPGTGQLSGAGEQTRVYEQARRETPQQIIPWYQATQGGWTPPAGYVPIMVNGQVAGYRPPDGATGSVYMIGNERAPLSGEWGYDPNNDAWGGSLEDWFLAQNVMAGGAALASGAAAPVAGSAAAPGTAAAAAPVAAAPAAGTVAAPAAGATTAAGAAGGAVAGGGAAAGTGAAAGAGAAAGGGAAAGAAGGAAAGAGAGVGTAAGGAAAGNIVGGAATGAANNIGNALLGASAIDALLGIGGSMAGADAINDASRRATDLQREMFNTTRADFAPWREQGVAALQQLGALQSGDFSGFNASPDYQFRLNQGINALDRSAASRGRLYSGAQMRAAQDYGQQSASQEYGNYWNRLAGLAGVGQSATGSVANAGQNFANQANQNYLNAGNATASSYQGIGNALGGFGRDAAYGYGAGLFGGGNGP